MNNKNKEPAFYEKKADENKYLYFDKISCARIVTTTAHFHDSIEIVFVTKGKCGIHINGTEILLFEGDAAFIDRFDIHYYEYFEDSEYYVFLISEKYLDGVNDFNKKRLPEFLPRCKNSDGIRKIFDSIYNLWKMSNETFRIGTVNVVLGALSTLYPLAEREHKGDVKMLVETLIYINENFAENINLEFFSEKFGYSKNYFSALFNKFAGMNLREYINRRRISEFERIKDKNPEFPTYAIVQECGFNSLKTFYRSYHKYSKNRKF